MSAHEPQHIIENRSNMIASGRYDKALIKNLRAQSPFQEGARNRDFVNPSLTSNVVFYNHGLERVENPHVRVPKHEWRPSGYNLEDYVNHDAQRAQMPLKGSAIDSRAGEGKKKAAEAPRVDEDARSNAPERHYQKSRKSAPGSERASSSHVARGQEPTHWNAKTQTRETAREAASAPQAEEAPVGNMIAMPHGRAQLRMERDVERSVRSRNKTAENKPHDQELKEHEHAHAHSNGDGHGHDHGNAHGHGHDHAHAHGHSHGHDHGNGKVLREGVKQSSKEHGHEGHPSYPSKTPSGQEIVYDLGHNKIGVVSKDKAPVVIIDKDGISRCGTIYEKVSDSQISQPDNLVCDNCANRNIHEQKLQDAADQRLRDQEFAQKVSDNMRQQLEEERKRQLDKLRVYQDAIDKQRKDQIDRKEADKMAQEVENEKIRKNLDNRDDEIARLEKERMKKLNFIGDLKDQMENKKALEDQKRRADEEEAKRHPNLLIDDGWRQPHREAMKDYYKNYLIDQVNEAEKNKEKEKDKLKREDDEYKKKLAQLNADELNRQRQIEDDKKRIFMEEVDKQLLDKEKMKDFENRIKAAEDDNYRRKLEQDRQAYLDNIFKKKKQVDEYLQTLGKQIVDKDMEKRIAELEAKKRYNTTLCLGKKPTKCYNCAVCRNIYPLKMLNKKHRLA